MKYLFIDLDGTLAPSRQKASAEMVKTLYTLTQDFDQWRVIIVSGAEAERIKHQIPLDLTLMSQNGNVMSRGNEILWENKLENKKEILQHIRLLTQRYIFAEIEDRGSQMTVSFTGFNALQSIKNKFDTDKKSDLKC